MTERAKLLEAANRAQRFAEESGVDEKYKPFLFYRVLEVELTYKVGEGVVKRGETEHKGSPLGKASAPSAIMTLFMEGYFEKGKKVREVVGYLAERGFHFGYNTTKSALRRAEYLQTEGSKGDLVYFQRYPVK